VPRQLRGGFDYYEGRRQRPLFNAKPKPLPEAVEQTLLINWRNKNAERHPALRWLHAIPNGLFLGGSRKRGALAVIQGLTSGISDLFLPYPVRLPLERCGVLYCGLYIEMKTRGRKPTPEQAEFISFVREAGYKAIVAYSWQEAARELVDYLKLKEFTPII
jgi:hypothetical protein